MPKLKVYLDTSVLGALYDVEDASRLDVTKQLLAMLKTREDFIPYISNIVIEEIEKAPSHIRKSLHGAIKDLSLVTLYETDLCIDLVNEYVKKQIIPKKYRDDARHIAVAVVHGIDIIVTWNCRHMANVEKKRVVNAVNMVLGYKQIDIVTPWEVGGHG